MGVAVSVAVPVAAAFCVAAGVAVAVVYVSCRTMSRLELESTIPVKPPIVKRKIKPRAHRLEGMNLINAPWEVLTHLKILILQLLSSRRLSLKHQKALFYPFLD